MSPALDKDDLNHLWAHTLHEDDVFNNRLSFFLVFESVLLGVSGVIFNSLKANPSIRVPLAAFLLFGLLITMIWAYAQARHRHVLGKIADQLKAADPLYAATLANRGQWPVSVIDLLTFGVPLLVGSVWVVFLIAALQAP